MLDETHRTARVADEQERLFCEGWWMIPGSLIGLALWVIIFQALLDLLA